jgi:hypothetical protein
MYIEYIEKFLDKVKKAYAKLFKKNLKQPVRKKTCPAKKKTQYEKQQEVRAPTTVKTKVRAQA